MTEGIIVALITGGFTLLGVLASNKKTYAVLETKVEELMREVREHNGFARRMPVVEEQITHIKEDITELKNYHK